MTPEEENLALYRILYCFSDHEGTWFEWDWERFGVDYKTATRINERYEELWEARLLVTRDDAAPAASDPG